MMTDWRAKENERAERAEADDFRLLDYTILISGARVMALGLSL